MHSSVGRRLIAALSLATLVGSGLPSATTALAAGHRFVVNSQLDQVDAHPGDGACRTAAGTCTLRAAVQEANARAGADTIVVPTGTYTLTIPDANPQAGEDQAATGDLDIRDDLTIEGAGASTTILDASQVERTLEIFGPAHVRATGLSLRNHGFGNVLTNHTGTVVLGQVAMDSVGIDRGDVFDLDIHNEGTLSIAASTLTGGQECFGCFDVPLIVNTGTLSITSSSLAPSANGQSTRAIINSGNLTMTSTSARGNGSSGVIGNDGTLVMTNGSLTGFADDDVGGGLRNTGTATLRGVRISTSAGNGGGGIANLGTLDLDEVTIFGSRTGEGGIGGGGILHGGPRLTIAHSRIVDNHTDDGPGGGLLIAGGDVTISDTIIRANSASVGGGGIAADRRAPVFPSRPLHLTITNSIISDNTAGPLGVLIGLSGGGGIAFDGAQLTITNSTITGNTAHQGQGGGLFVAGGSALVTNTDLVANVVPDLAGAGAGVAGPASLLNTLVAHNHGLTASGSTSTEANCGPGVLSRGHNLDGGTTCPFSAAGDLRHTNPKLAPLGFNGGATPTFALLPGSPAIDAGTNTGCPSTDQRGLPRPRDGNADGTASCDIGAYEVP